MILPPLVFPGSSPALAASIGVDKRPKKIYYIGQIIKQDEFCATTLSITTFSISTFSITTLSITTFNIIINKTQHSAWHSA